MPHGGPPCPIPTAHPSINPPIHHSINPILQHPVTPSPHHPMIIGVPREIKDQEYRVALLPSAAYQLIQRGHQVLVERNAGAGAGYPDEDYAHAGATLVSDHAEAFEKADLVVKVKEPLPSDRKSTRLKSSHLGI